MMKDKWLNTLHDRITNESHAQAPQGLLDDIKQEMARRGIAPQPAPSHSSIIIPMWLYRSIAVAAIFLIAFCLVGVHQESPSSQPCYTIAKKQEQYNAPDIKLVAPRSATKLNKKVVLLAECSTSIAEESMPDVTEEGGEKKQTKQPMKEKVKRDLDNSYSTTHRKHAQQSRFSISTSYNYAAGTSNSTQGMLLASESENPLDHEVHAEQGEVQAKHRHPVKFGVSVKYAIDNRWSLQTGLTYSYLTSELTYSNDNQSYTAKQNLHYVGVPVSISYSLIKNKRFGIYIAAGGEVQKLTKGTQQKLITTMPQSDSEAITTIKESPLQCSINAAIGSEYWFSKELGIYIEPTFSYYINNGSNVNNIYKDTPMQLGLNIGIKVNLNNK